MPNHFPSVRTQLAEIVATAERAGDRRVLVVPSDGDLGDAAEQAALAHVAGEKLVMVILGRAPYALPLSLQTLGALTFPSDGELAPLPDEARTLARLRKFAEGGR
jgi:hypothetical protein